MELIGAIQAVNRAVNSLDPSELFNALKNPVLGLDGQESQEESIKEVDAVHYLQLLRDIQRNRSEYSNIIFYPLRFSPRGLLRHRFISKNKP